MSSSADVVSADSLNVAVCQLTSTDDISSNADRMESLLETMSGPIDLVCFPENSLYLRLVEGEKIPPLAIDNEAITRLSRRARELKCFIHIGSVPLKSEGGLYNASLLIDRSGGVHDVYRKIHLFDVDVAGHKPVRESDAFKHGSKPSVFEVNGWKIGSSICYDLRFAELYSGYAKQGVDAIVIPSAFLVPTGKAHWDVLTRARAIESQAYVLAAAQGGRHVGKTGKTRDTFGHSVIVDPWGVVVESLSDDFGQRRVLRARLEKARIREVRGQIPMSGHRRL